MLTRQIFQLHALTGEIINDLTNNIKVLNGEIDNQNNNINKLSNEYNLLLNRYNADLKNCSAIEAENTRIQSQGNAALNERNRLRKLLDDIDKYITSYESEQKQKLNREIENEINDKSVIIRSKIDNIKLVAENSIKSWIEETKKIKSGFGTKLEEYGKLKYEESELNGRLAQLKFIAGERKLVIPPKERKAEVTPEEDEKKYNRQLFENKLAYLASAVLYEAASKFPGEKTRNAYKNLSFLIHQATCLNEVANILNERYTTYGTLYPNSWPAFSRFYSENKNNLDGDICRYAFNLFENYALEIGVK